MQLPLSQEQVDGIWKTLTLEQQNWINKYINQRKRDKWFEALALRKGIVLDDQMSDEQKRNMVDDWELMEVLDGGEGNRPFKCECGKPLRYQYIVYHKSKDETYGLGSTCIEHYTGLQSDVVRDIKSGILQINTKRDELLIKIQAKQFTDLIRYIEKGIEIPESISKQVQIGIPLFNDQLHDLEKSLEELKWKKWYIDRKNRQQVLKQIEVPQDQFIYIEESTSSKENFRCTYESFIEENLANLKQIREREERLSPKLQEEWEWMQDEVRRFKREGTMDFDTFLLRMNNMMIPLRITK
jgi:hypothetical protein